MKVAESFCVFILNLYFIFVSLGDNALSESTMFVITLISTFLLLLSLGYSYYKEDITYFFGIMSIYYCPFVIYLSGISFYSLGSILATLYLIYRLSWLELIINKISKQRVIKSIISLSGIKVSKFVEKLITDTEIKEYRLIEDMINKLYKSLSEAESEVSEHLFQTVKRLEQLKADFAKLIVRRVELSKILSEFNRDLLMKEIENIKLEIKNSNDDVVKAHLEETKKLKEKRVEEFEKLITCSKRIDVQKEQIKELLKVTNETINSLKFADIHVMKARSSELDKEIDKIKNELEGIEKGFILAQAISVVEK